MQRFHTALSGLRILLLAGFAIMLAACSDGGSSSMPSIPSTTLSGTAAVGAPIDGYVYVQDGNGSEVNTATDPASGDWSVTVEGMNAPFLIRVVPNGGGDTLYSFANAANLTVNVTSLTHLATYLAFNGDVSALYTNWAANHAELTAEAILNAQAIINANFATEMDAADLDHTTYDFFSAAFAANSTGIDALLDRLRISIDFTGNSFTVSLDDSPFAFDVNIDTSGITIGGGGDDDDDDTVTLSCNTSNYVADAVRVPTADELAGFAATYTGEEGTYGDDMMNPTFAPSGEAIFVLKADGTASYNGDNYAITSFCLDITGQTQYPLIYLEGPTHSHLDLWDNGDMAGISPNGAIIRN
ncbi:MAG: hypothetical protein IPG64_21885 [Haliea sp.]|nr:hypothetical protein [Haliea sp.]